MVKEIFKERINEVYREKLRQDKQDKDKNRNPSATSMAGEANISAAAMNFYLSGKRCPDIEALTKICKYFNCSADWLLGLSNVRTPSQDVRLAVEALGISEGFIGKLKYLDEHAKKALFHMLETDGFFEVVLDAYMDYMSLADEIRSKKQPKDDEYNLSEYPVIHDDVVSLPVKDGIQYYAGRTGNLLNNIMMNEVLDDIAKMGYDFEDIY